MILTVFKMDDYSLKFDGPTLDLEQNLPEASPGIHTDSVVIHPTIYVSLS
jgi:hypothetical protein